MIFDAPDIETFKQHLEASIKAAEEHKTDDHAAIKIQSLLNVTIYVMAVRFLEGSVKHIVYNCAVMRGDSTSKLEKLERDLKDFNNPDFKNIRDLFKKNLNFDIHNGMKNKNYLEKDLTFLNEIVRNRHKNVHANSDAAEWYNQNKKDLTDFKKEYAGLLNILHYLDRIRFDKKTAKFFV